MVRRGVPLLVSAALLAAPTHLLAQDTQAAAADRIPPARKFYLGRQIAPTMHFSHADWLIRDERKDEENTELVLKNLGIKPGMTVCDMGCGNGFYTLKMAELVGPQGSVLAVDIQSEMLRLLRYRAETSGIDNVIPILGSVHNPRLPAGQLDLVLLADVYHEFSHPEAMLQAMRRALKPDGAIVLLEFRAEDPQVPIRPLHKMSRAQIMKELPANRYKLVREFDGLPWQHMMFFGRADD